MTWITDPVRAERREPSEHKLDALCGPGHLTGAVLFEMLGTTHTTKMTNRSYASYRSYCLSYA
jgi:hypothetical protein